MDCSGQLLRSLSVDPSVAGSNPAVPTIIINKSVQTINPLRPNSDIPFVYSILLAIKMRKTH